MKLRFFKNASNINQFEFIKLNGSSKEREKQEIKIFTPLMIKPITTQIKEKAITIENRESRQRLNTQSADTIKALRPIAKVMMANTKSRNK